MSLLSVCPLGAPLQGNRSRAQLLLQAIRSGWSGSAEVPIWAPPPPTHSPAPQTYPALTVCFPGALPVVMLHPTSTSPWMLVVNVLGRGGKAQGELGTRRDPAVWAPALASLRQSSSALCSLLPQDPGILASSVLFAQTRRDLSPFSSDPVVQTPSPQFMMAHLWWVPLSPPGGLSPISYHASPPLGA